MAVLPPWRGRWTRDRLIVPGTPDDVTTTVIWLQSGHLFADLRVPAGRPDFTGCTTLADCSPTQLDWLAKQEGFAGHLETYGDVMRWHRHFEFGPPAQLPDAGRMSCQGAWWLEEGLHAPYLEHWRHDPWRGGPCLGAKFMLGPSPDEDGWREGVVVVVDDAFMLAIDGLRKAPATPRIATDVEISFGTLDPVSGAASISLSTLPFREHLLLMPREDVPGPAPLRFVHEHPALRDRPLHWQDGETT